MIAQDSEAVSLFEKFEYYSLDARLAWLNPPRAWTVEAGGLRVEPEAGSDFWQKTHYGISADSGHLLFAKTRRDFILTTQVRFDFANQYDQAGLMVRISAHCWIKTSVEFEPGGPARLGAVVTNGRFSDWSTQDFPNRDRVRLRIRRKDGAYGIDHALVQPESSPETPSEWIQMRLTHLAEDDGSLPLLCGLYACSPKGTGFVARFDFLRLEAP